MIELLSPAGDLEKLYAAIRYGADAVYIGGKRFGMRAAAGNFTRDEMAEGIAHAHANGRRVYVAVNISPRTEEYEALSEYLAEVAELGADALIVGDIGVLALVRRTLPDMPIHISTQANVMSVETAKAFAALGASRIVLSRELSLDEVAKIRRELPLEIELECFVHGAMCVSYSGRCLLSNYLSGRDAGHGACTQPCRWHYRAERVTAELIEEKRPDEPIPIYEEEGETFFMSSRDLCMIEHIPALIAAGVASFKIEGRMKSAYYTAVVTNAYRMAIDACLTGRELDSRLLGEVGSVSHRDYDTGFFFDSPHTHAKITERDGYLREKAYLAVAEDFDEPMPENLKAIEVNENGKLYRFRQRNKLVQNMTAELLTPGKVGVPFTVAELYDGEGEAVESAPHPSRIFYTRVPFEVKEGDILRAE